MPEKNPEPSTIYLHGRPSSHALHAKFARAVTPHFRFVDENWRWQDKNYPAAINMLAWLWNALWFKGKKKYNVYLVDNLHVTPVIMRSLGLLSKKQKLVVHLGSHTLYFMHANKFGKLNNKLHKWALKKYDALICEGNMAANLAQDILKEKCPPVYVTILGPLHERLVILNQVQPQLDGNKILVIANGPTAFRDFYKGLDLMIAGFTQALKKNPQLELHIIGDWEQPIIDRYRNSMDNTSWAQIHFKGRIENLHLHLKEYALCLHCARGDAFPTSTIETVSAGIPTIVSEWTGTREIIQAVDPGLVSKLDITDITEKINWYFSLDLATRKIFSDKGRVVAQKYNEEDATELYRQTFKKICNDLSVGK